jgi:potassium/hydrogen antiporter
MVVDSGVILSQVSFIAVILLVGLLTSIFSKKLNLPDLLMLIIAGIVLGAFVRFENLGFALPETFIAGLGIFALILIIFDSTSKIRLKELDWVSGESFKITMASVISVVVIFSLIVWGVLFRFSPEALFPSIIFATIMAGTAPDVLLNLLGNNKHKILEILKIESILNTPFVVLLPIMVIQISEELTSGFVSEFFRQLMVNIIAGIGTGVLVGIILFKFMRNVYSDQYSPIAVIAGALISYTLAENIGGNGVLAVTVLGIFFANLDIKQKVYLLHFESVLTKLLTVLIFVLIGIIVKLPLNLWFFINSFILFAGYLVARYVALAISAREFKKNERIFMTLTAAKGLPVIIVTFILATVFVGFENILDYVFIITLYSLTLASLTAKYGMHLIEDPKPKKK